jgi:hypothetical protein
MQCHAPNRQGRNELHLPASRHRQAHAIGSWAKAAFLPPEMFHALLQSLTAEWLEAGSDASATAVAEALALVAYRGKEASAR